ncbi:MdtA/MuxA family multidrug efflux RND transporter periplasmic adaptor subunit [Crenobacter sp. SG2303]|uniref:MdtA/MuxA family multidrug efflux RND transporter periplasmic adaptor subunit n=1 Tax=Crenobacter oryzisoli TaxID=3056844 RepID=A0ABT7XT37_9NEIS|nr:MdtA/MuxA family multidrug efflux RND transporter periplasmic adaptor subunit [Crenobacter sp. SG2303]MDN0076968.1 MdtA/MuxA family multidrug efflux RND transporter periplasmic adaptor subunit [Crenobacter sp. SG2303]
MATPPPPQHEPTSTSSLSKSDSGRKKLLAVLVIAAIAGLGWHFMHQSPADGAGYQSGRHGMGKTGAPQPVTAKPAVKTDMTVYLNALGTVTANYTATVRSLVNGQLEKVYFHEGQQVKAGDLLAQVDPRPFQVLLTQAEGQLAKDQALLKNAQIDLLRYKALLAQNSIAEQQVATQEALVRQYQGSVKADQGQVDSAKLQLTYSRITAPISGRVGLRQVDPGNNVSTGDTNGIVVITQEQPMNVVYPVPEASLGAIIKARRTGGPLPVEAWDRENTVKLADGKLLTTDNLIDTTTGTLKLKAQFQNTENALFPNQFVNIRMKLETQQGVTAIPTAALQRGKQGNFVYLVKPDQTVTLRKVTTGPTEGDQVAVTDGLQPGDLVVVDGVDQLREGTKIVQVKPGGSGGKHKGPHGKGASDNAASGPAGEASKHHKGQA